MKSFINHMIDHHNAKAFRPKKYKAFLNALNEFIQFFQQVFYVFHEDEYEDILDESDLP